MFDFKAHKNRTLIMGILNITPDSFSDGGKSFDAGNALLNAVQMEKDGADIIDVGACSTAPGRIPVSAEEEISRLEKVLPVLLSEISVPLSVDTRSPAAAEFALGSGAVIVNDESGIFCEKMASVVKRYGAGWIFMHTGGKSSSEAAFYENGVTESVMSFFSEMKRLAEDFGIPDSQLCFDCGLGFGKTRSDDLTLLKNTGMLSSFGPLLVGVSKKRVIGEITGEEKTENRLFGSVAAETLAAFLGADILRVHDVKACADAVKISDAVKRGHI